MAVAGKYGTLNAASSRQKTALKKPAAAGFLGPPFVAVTLRAVLSHVKPVRFRRGSG